MQVNKLTKTITGLLFATVATSSMASNSLAEDTGNKLANISDSVYTSITGKQVNNVEINHPVSLFNYSEASSSYEDAYLNGALNVKDSKDKKTSYDLRLGVDYTKVTSSPDANIKYEAGIDGKIEDDGIQERNEDYEGYAAATYDKYFNSQVNDSFWYGKGEARIKEKEGDSAGLKHPEVKITGGLGYGRVVNVTPLAKSMRLVEALVENGNLSRVPSATVYQQIAKIIDKEESYKKKYPDNYEQFWISDIQKALGANLGASGVIRAYEVLTEEKISTRKYGWDVRAGVGMVANNFDGDSGNPTLELQGNYYYPISNKTQFSNEARLSAELDDDDDSYVLSNDMSLTYELTDRVDWENKWNMTYENNEKSEDVLTNALSSSFSYELSNSLDYKLTANMSHKDPEHSESSWDKALFMGVEYRLK